MTPIESLLQETCCAAANDLGVNVISPFRVVDSHGEAHDFIALFPCFGSEKGTVICNADDWVAKTGIAAAQAYFCSGLHLDSYCRYDRGLWIETFCDWGWLGPPEQRPDWCKK